MDSRKQLQINTVTIFLILKAILFGLLSTEIVYFSNTIASDSFNQLIITENKGWVIFITSLVSGISLLVTLLYFFRREIWHKSCKIWESKRFDIFLAFGYGILVSIIFKGIGSRLYEHISSFISISFYQLLALVILPLVISLALLLHLFLHLLMISKKKKEAILSFFINDQEKNNIEEDLLQFSNKVEKFAERVYNRGSSDSLVFGIDAPWGVGKSTFVNLCVEYWKENYKEQVIVYKFDPIRYESKTDLMEKFIDGLIRTIRDNCFIPEIKPLVSHYSRFVKNTKSTTIGFPWINIEMLWGAYTIDHAWEDLKIVLKMLNKKIIIVVDDLDRMNFAAIKDILFVIKTGFNLPYLSYILCYDNENIGALEDKSMEIEKVTEFLEKFVNIKYNLCLDSKVLEDYVNENLHIELRQHLEANPFFISQTIGALKGLYKSDDYHKYSSLIGDLRKIKRLINITLLSEIEKTDFKNSDIDKNDLLHLLLIYINFPNIFRKIYETETNGKRGFFSLSTKPVNNSNVLYENSPDYKEYLKETTPKQKFLLEKVFDEKRVGTNTHDNAFELKRRSLACFNGSNRDRKNLEDYLNLIVNFSKPPKETQFRFYLNCKDEIIQGKLIKNVLSGYESFENENNHEQFWRVMINSMYDFTSAMAEKVIIYLLNNIQNYSLLEYKDIGLGLRHDISKSYLISALDTAGWSDKSGKHSNNTDENISEIAEWIFGEGRHKEYGIINILGKEERGILGFYDLLLFRLFCRADRGGDIFNLERALAQHGNQNAPTTGKVRTIAIEEMREISQKIFALFKKQYIDKNKNVFQIIDNLSLKDLAGNYDSYVKEKISSGAIKEENIHILINKLKSRLKVFITYQLGNSLIDSGGGYGYYDPSGNADKEGIRIQISDYLFTVCFNPSKSNYEHFMDYLLLNLHWDFATENDGRKYIPHINEFTKVLERKKLADYWKENGDKIKSLKFHEQEKLIYTSNYTACYKDDLEEVYNVLDKLVLEIEEEIQKQEEPLEIVQGESK